MYPIVTRRRARNQSSGGNNENFVDLETQTLSSEKIGSKIASSGASVSEDSEGLSATILQSGDGQKREIAVSVKTTLRELKILIQNVFNIEPSGQRLFYLGRELKSNGRSLGNIGFGNYNNTFIHLVSHKTGKGGIVARGSRPVTELISQPARSINLTDVILLDDDDDDDEVEIIDSPSGTTSTPAPSRKRRRR
mmetsp:Transcript_31354/g.62139  ORF Transcript_31354/g.62139 Transcript_31354/m.62139 type:complete len:194 (-) Transcript_31354:126-707(-)